MNDEEVDVSISVPTEAVDGSTNTTPEPGEIAPAPTADTATKWGLNRRKFLTAAALGTAAATMLNKGSGGYLHLGAASALADDLSGLGCTANDVRIVSVRSSLSTTRFTWGNRRSASRVASKYARHL